jgi:hypothetical protein
MIVEIREEILDVDEFLIRRRKPGSDPVAHVPAPEDPRRPKCNKNSGTGLGYRPIDEDRVDPDQVCGSCLERDRNGADAPIVSILEEANSIEEARELAREKL